MICHNAATQPHAQKENPAAREAGPKSQPCRGTPMGCKEVVRLPRSDPTVWSAYWGAPAAHTRAREAVGAAESDPKRTLGAQETVQIVGRIHSTGLIPVSLITRAQ